MTRLLPSVCLLLVARAAMAEPLLTGVVEDVSAQTIEMPSLPGAWQRQIEWMAQEGSEVAAGDIVVRLDPGDLISREEQTRTDLEKVRLSAARRRDELQLAIMDAERAVLQAESAVRLAELDAIIPAATIPKLDYERYQLTLETAKRNLIRAEAELLNKRREYQDVIRETTLEVERATSRFARIEASLRATTIRAAKTGFLIYGENPRNGKKIFPGETLYSGLTIASVASRDDLQILFWVHEADIRKLALGELFTVTADALGSQAFDTRIEWISSQAVEKEDWSRSGYFRVHARPVQGIPEGVMPGMSVMGRPLPGMQP